MELTDVWLLFLCTSAFENCVGTVSTKAMLRFIPEVTEEVPVPKLRPRAGLTSAYRVGVQAAAASPISHLAPHLWKRGGRHRWKEITQ